ncbi:Helicase SWR1 [Psilocybe cubensis]|uniref:Helicase SWR1 n=2 Tax=Psilocybe cubensis TaxID=181762 RepID=A0A8H8CNL3_PSICU|nr:Helicase SWR1 [Psilocybe cubensis]KAH9485667.1 Helicase SWR1 [Psilocybe cubensis]
MSWNGTNGSVAGSGVSGTRSRVRASARSVFIDDAEEVNDLKKRTRRSAQVVESTADTLEFERAALLANKQVELEQVVDRHDDLVRELFHMENFTMMLSYDPAEAKKDRTVVFREYKSKYDLIDNVTPSAGPSRQTRGRHNERRQILSNPSISSSLSQPQPSRRKGKSKMNSSEIMETLHNAATKGKGKRKEQEQEPTKESISSAPRIITRYPPEPISAPISVSVLPIVHDLGSASIPSPPAENLAPSTSKFATPSHEALGEQPAIVADTTSTVPEDSVVVVNRKSEQHVTVPNSKTISNVVPIPATSAPSPPSPTVINQPAADVVAVSAPVDLPEFVVRRKSARNVKEPDTVSIPIKSNNASPIVAAAPFVDLTTLGKPHSVTGKKRRHSDHEKQAVSLDVMNNAGKTSSNAHTNDMAPCFTETPEESISTNLKRRSERFNIPTPGSVQPKAPKIKLKPPVADEDRAPLREPLAIQSNVVLPSPSKIKRIKLIVRRPPPLISSPRQFPPEPKFNSSLPSFLSSYINIDEEDMTMSALEEEAKSEASIREQVVRFNREGRFIPGTDVLFGTEPPTVEHTSPQRSTTDTWDHIVEAVIARGKAKPKKSIGLQITSQISSKLQAHFDGLESRKAKAKEAEEKRLRKLAKSTMMIVIGEWKKAVYHLREQQRLEEEAEERRLGREHLDAILDQSGQLLETQQGDLLRGDMYGSRSSSGSMHDFDTDEDDDEADENDGEGDDGDDEDDDEEEDNDDENDDAGTQSLLGESSVNEMGVDNLDPLLSTPRSLASRATTEAFDSEHTELDDPEVSTAQLLNSGLDQRDDDMDSNNSFDRTLENLAIPEPESSPQRPLKVSVLHPSDLLKAGSSDIPMQGSEPLPESVSHNTLGLDYVSQSESDIGPENNEDVEPNDSTTRSGPPQAASASPKTNVLNTDRDVPPVLSDNAEDSEMVDLPSADNEIVDEPEAINVSKKPNTPEKDLPEFDGDLEAHIPEYLKPYAVAPVDWDPEAKITPPLLLRGVLRPYQQSGLEWLASLHLNRLNGILADEMGLGKTIQTIALLAHLACDRGIWGPHLIVVPTSVLLNWEMEFKKFLPGFRVLSYHGSTKRRKELRQGWNDKHHFNVCITSYTLASRDAHIFKRKPWYYMILDEAHMIKNFKSQRWNILLMFRSFRRLLLTGTPLQNNLTELWALLQFLMSGANFANLKEFGEWFSNPLEKAIEMGGTYDDETMQRVSKLHTVLRPYLLRRLKRDVEKELPSKFDHLTLCPLSKRQRFLYDEFMSRAQTKDALESGVYQKIANVLMQLRKVCNHPDLFEVRPIVTSFAMTRSAIADYEIKELLVRRRLLMDEDETVDLNVVGLRFVDHQNVPLMTSIPTRNLNATKLFPYYAETLDDPPPKDFRTVAGFKKYSAYVKKANDIARWNHLGYLNNIRCSRMPFYPEEMISVVERMTKPIVPLTNLNPSATYLDNVDRVNQAVKSYATRAKEMENLIDNFAFVTPAVVALDLPRLALSGYQDTIQAQPLDFDSVLHRATVKLQIAFPDPSLLQYDCGKLQRLATLLREKKSGGHRVLIFTQMTRILDILEIFLNFHGYLYLRLDGATKIEDRQYITERFNADPRIFCFIASSRSGGVGINLTGADTVIFYDSDFNPQMDKQCEDRAHRIGQIRDVHIYRFISQHTVEEAMLLKANQKRSLDDLVIQKGEFDWRTLFKDEGALTKALENFEDAEDRRAAMIAAREEISLVGADEDDFGEMAANNTRARSTPADEVDMTQDNLGDDVEMDGGVGPAGNEDREYGGGSVVDYMLAFIEDDWDFFEESRLYY